jgi:hypothetical protein
MKGEHCVRLLCEMLGVSSSGYYGWRQKRPSKRQREDAALAAKIGDPPMGHVGILDSDRYVFDEQGCRKRGRPAVARNASDCVRLCPAGYGAAAFAPVYRRQSFPRRPDRFGRAEP